MPFVGCYKSKLRELSRGREQRAICLSALVLVLGLPPASAQPQSFVEPANGAALTPRQNEILSAIKNLPSTEEASIVRLNTDALQDGHQISIPTASKSVPIQNNSRQSQGDSTVWSGAAPNETNGSTTIVVNNQNVTGSIQTTDGYYRISPLGDGLHALIKINPKNFPPEHPTSQPK